jgi:hypothetical protein
MKRLLKLLILAGLFATFTLPAMAQSVLPAYHEGFQHGTGIWITDETPGPGGWCGDIEQYTRGSGPVGPSKGNGYAVVAHGDCNDYWRPIFSEGSGPYAPFGGYSGRWPEGGFTTELDIYLDPDWASGTHFTYAVSFDYLGDQAPSDPPYRYLMVPVAVADGQLTVDGEPVNEAGWYTFRQRFMNEGGYLAVEFELTQKGDVLFTKAVDETSSTGEPIASFDVNDVGTGYSWFVAIAEGLRLPIDEHAYVPSPAAGGGGAGR